MDAQEGLSYLWTEDEIREVLESSSGRFSADDVDLFLRVYGVIAGPNFADPHHGTGLPDKNILFLPTPLANVASRRTSTKRGWTRGWSRCGRQLYAARRKRKQPLLDTKILTSWNALMIRAFAVAGRRWGRSGTWRRRRGLRNSSSVVTAGRMERLFARRDRTPPPRTKRRGSTASWTIMHFSRRRCSALHQATGEIRWRDEAGRTAGVMKEKFADPEFGAYFFTAADATDLIVRQKTASDSPLPSGNAVAAMTLLALGETRRRGGRSPSSRNRWRTRRKGCLRCCRRRSATTCRAGRRSRWSAGGAVEEAGARPPTPGEVAREVMELSARWTTPVELIVRAKVTDTFHLNAHQAGRGLIPTTLALSLSDGGAVAATIDYPPGEERKFAFADQAIRVYRARD